MKKQVGIKLITPIDYKAATFFGKLIIVLTLLAVALIVSGLIDF